MFTGNFTAAVVEHYNQLLLQVTQVQSLVLVQLLHGLTERDGGRTPGVPGRSAAHPPRQTGLQTLQEVVVLLLLLLVTGVLRPVEEVVLGDGDEVSHHMAGLHVPLRLVLQPDPGEDLALHHVVEPGVVDDDSVADMRVEIEGEVVALAGVRRHFVRVDEGVAHPEVDIGHLAAPHGGVHRVLLHTGAQMESVLRHTAANLWR